MANLFRRKFLDLGSRPSDKGRGGHPDPEIRRRGPVSKTYFFFGPQFGLKIRGRPPGSLPWIRHCNEIQDKRFYIVYFMYSHWKIQSIERALKVTLIQFNVEAKSPAGVAGTSAFELNDTGIALVFMTVCLFQTANSRWQGSGWKPGGNLVPRDLSNSRGRVEEGPRNQVGKLEVRTRLRAVRELHHVSIAITHETILGEVVTQGWVVPSLTLRDMS